MAIEKVIIIGAGPSGLLLAIFLLQASIPFEVLERESGINQSPRATHYLRPACNELRRAGVLDEIVAQGFLSETISWRKRGPVQGDRIAQFRLTDGGDLGMTCLPQPQVCQIMLEKLASMNAPPIKFGHAAVNVGQDGNKAWVGVKSDSGTERLYASYIAGCDGGGSTVRKTIYGEDFPGFTWEQQLVATNVRYDITEYDYDDINAILHTEHPHNFVRMSKTPGLYRVTYAERGEFTKEMLRNRLSWKYENILPGNPKPGSWILDNFSPFRVHQRIVDNMRNGRVLLAGDAAHLTNPIGGFGLSGAICDIGALADSLVGIHTEQADDSILDTWGELRRKTWREVTDKHSSRNFRGTYLANVDEMVEFWKNVDRKEMEASFWTMDLLTDMKQYYYKPITPVNHI